MTVLANDTVERFTVSGVGPYAYNFRIFAETDLRVTVCSTVTPPVPTLLTYLSDYTVTGANVATGGTVLLVSDVATTYAGYTLDIRSVTPNTQPTSIRNTGRFLPEAHEDAFDRLSRQVQDHDRQLLACVRYPDNVLNDAMMTPLSGWLSKYLTVNSSGILEAAVLSPTAVTASAITSLLSGSTSEQDAILALLVERTDTSPALTSLKRTAAEIAAGVTPVNYAYAPGRVDRYKTNTTPGMTSMAAGFQASIDQARMGGADVIWGDTQPYLVDAALDCTFGSGANQNGLTFRQIGGTSQDAPAAILFKHTGYCFDLTGCDAYTFHHLTATTDATTFPKVCFFQARANVAGDNSQVPRIYNTKVIGKFSVAIQYNYGTEIGVYAYNYWVNSAGTSAKVVYISANNILSLTSSFVTIRTGAQSCIDHQYIGGQYINLSSNASADIFYLDNVYEVKWLYPWVDCGSAAGVGGRSIIYVDTTTGPSSGCKLIGMQVEALPTQQAYGIYFGNTATTIVNWEVAACFMPALTAAVGLNSNVILDTCFIHNVRQVASTGLVAPGTVRSCFIYGLVLINIGTSTGNVIINNAANTTRSAHTFDILFDIGTGKIIADGQLAGSSLAVTAGLGVFGNSPPAQVTGFGTPTGNVVVNNYPGATATLVQTSNTVAEILVILKGMGVIGA